MGYDIKLKVFTIRLKKYNAKKNKELSWKELFDKFLGKEEERFNAFFKGYMESFDNKFIRYKNWPKAIHLPKDKLVFKSESRMFYSEMEGGPTDQRYIVKAMTNDGEEIVVDRDKVQALPFHVLFYIPNDSNVGLLIIQSFGDLTMYDILKLNFNNYVRSVDDKFIVDFAEQVPKELEKIYTQGNIKSIIVRKYGISSDEFDSTFSKKYNNIGDIKVELKISFPDKINNHNLIKKLRENFLARKPQLFDLQSIKPFDFTENSDLFVKFEYNKRETTAKVEDGFKLSPAYIVDKSDVPLNAYNVPDSESMKKYMFDFVEKMIKEIGQ